MALQGFRGRYWGWGVAVMVRNRLAVAERSRPPMPHDRLDRFQTGLEIYPVHDQQFANFLCGARGLRGRADDPTRQFSHTPLNPTCPIYHLIARFITRFRLSDNIDYRSYLSYLSVLSYKSDIRHMSYKSYVTQRHLGHIGHKVYVV